MTTPTRKSIVDADRALIAGIRKHLSGQPFVFGRRTYSAQDVIDVHAGRIALAEDVGAAKSRWLAAIKEDADVRARTDALVRSLRTMLMGMFGEAPDILAEFGLTPRKRTKPSVATKAEAIVKAAATRKARGTMGKRQKKRVRRWPIRTEPVPAPVPVPVPAPAPAPALAPAPSLPGP